MLHSRPRRVAEKIKEALSAALQYEVSDPRKPAIFTITDVVVTKDLREATIYFSQLPDDEKALDNTEGFLDASMGYLRGVVARELNMKFTPNLHFRYDPSAANYQQINAVLQQLRRRGEKLDEPIVDDDTATRG
jgi:ribosome-binding factor A